MVYFNNIFRGVNNTGLWSTKGCDVDTAASNETHSVCKCDHLTNFAVLMQIKSDSDLEVNYVLTVGIRQCKGSTREIDDRARQI